MNEEVKIFPTWGYGRKGPQLFQLKEGEGLPKGYFDHPDKVPEPRQAGPDKLFEPPEGSSDAN